MSNINQYTCHDYNPLQDGKSRLQLLDSMGNDLEISNAARASFKKLKEELDTSGIKLIQFLIKHDHTSPFYHGQLQYQVKAPVFVVRQWYKHKIGTAENEMSGRYVDMSQPKNKPQFYIPKKGEWRGQSKINKQASNGVVSEYTQNWATESLERLCERAVHDYNELIYHGVAREMARMFLPLNLYTEFRWTSSLFAVMYFILLRAENSAQWEIQQYAQSLQSTVKSLFPHCYNAFMEEYYGTNG